ncbi:MAG: CIA30 family protein [Opitutae bacterium]|jgi:NADH dehydrogenase [ubiquinone] 1 alpha subcomplex assembly factor 1|nr:CIA30 family protein [Opitutae bacterium]
MIASCVCAASLLAKPHMKAEMNILFKFTGEHTDKPWLSSNDGVMGGRSAGNATLSDDGMHFSGTLSLENNGGFSSVYARCNFDLSDAEGVRLRVLGDGRTYQLRIHSDATFREGRAVNFAADFQTTAGEWIEVFVPFSVLEQSWRGRQLSGYIFNAKDIRRMALMLADKQAGPFSLRVAWIAAE